MASAASAMSCARIGPRRVSRGSGRFFAVRQVCLIAVTRRRASRPSRSSKVRLAVKDLLTVLAQRSIGVRGKSSWGSRCPDFRSQSYRHARRRFTQVGLNFPPTRPRRSDGSSDILSRRSSVSSSPKRWSISVGAAPTRQGCSGFRSARRIVADARCRSPARRPNPRRGGFRRRARKST